MKDIPKFALTLLIVTIIASGSLAWVNKITKPKIFAIQSRDLNNGLLNVLPAAKNGVIVPVKSPSDPDNILYYEGFADKDKTKLIGYAYLVPASGYSSIIRTLVGIDTVGNIISIQILSQQETPGLGTKCQEIRSGESKPWFQHQFAGKMATNLAVDKDGGDIVSLTGATITSRAITNAIADSSKSILGLINK
ncbi:hypothetical protein DRQ07_00860 [candidate division KSB1 bacterium]|nr:MAG: hypothetical protein DRQ07_00860 [candidate division KSB1 bacterium]